MDIETARRIVDRETERPCVAYRRLAEAVESADYPLTLADRDLVAGALEAVRRNQYATAVVALDELQLRMGIAEVREVTERAA